MESTFKVIEASSFKVGDEVICKEGFTIEEDSGGAGYEPLKRFKIQRISINRFGRYILWDENNVRGVYIEACRHFDPVKEVISDLRKEIAENELSENWLA